MRKIALLVALGMVTLGAVSLEEKREMLECYANSQDMMEKGYEAYASIQRMAMLGSWDSSVEYVNALNKLQIAVFSNCEMPIKRSLIVVANDISAMTNLLTELAYLYVVAEEIKLEKGRIER